MLPKSLSLINAFAGAISKSIQQMAPFAHGPHQGVGDQRWQTNSNPTIRNMVVLYSPAPGMLKMSMDAA